MSQVEAPARMKVVGTVFGVPVACEPSTWKMAEDELMKTDSDLIRDARAVSEWYQNNNISPDQQMMIVDHDIESWGFRIAVNHPTRSWVNWSSAATITYYWVDVT